MIICNIIGGLGNQMFQYAAGRALALRNKTELRLDISGFENYALHQGFELQRVFSCPAAIASPGDIRRILGWQSSSIARRILMRPRFAALRRRSFVVEPHFHYWPGEFKISGDCYLSGYWQSEKYFKSIEDIIRSEFSFKTALSGANAELAHQINETNAVSLHIRRGDYVENAKTLATHGVCSLDYYQKAIRHIAERMPHPVFFLFSDDIAWVKGNLKIDFPCRHVSHNRGLESYNDMHLMSLCRHHIIANSSFSWWGAWLNPYPNKIVIAPVKWFANGTTVDDLLPSDWIKL